MAVLIKNYKSFKIITMKKFKIIIINLCISIILSFFGIQASAQVDSLRLALDNVFAHVDKSQVPAVF
jgi:hypothetical protein